MFLYIYLPSISFFLLKNCSFMRWLDWFYGLSTHVAYFPIWHINPLFILSDNPLVTSIKYKQCFHLIEIQGSNLPHSRKSWRILDKAARPLDPLAEISAEVQLSPFDDMDTVSDTQKRRKALCMYIALWSKWYSAAYGPPSEVFIDSKVLRFL